MKDYSTWYDCVSCGHSLPVGTEKCPYCGLSYNNVNKTIKWKRLREIGDIVITVFFGCIFFAAYAAEDKYEEVPVWLDLLQVISFFSWVIFLGIWDKRIREIKPD